MAGDDDLPDNQALGGFRAEVERHYYTRSEVRELLEPVTTKVNEHLGWHDGQRDFWNRWIPVLCVAASVTAILVAALIK